MQDGLIRVTELATMLSVSRSTIWRWVKGNSTFPNPIKVSDKVTAWRRNEIQDWLQSKEGRTKKAFIE
jgi:prophage regulatory protein